jgi:hypothetical protein
VSSLGAITVERIIRTRMTQVSRTKIAQAVCPHGLAALPDDTDCNVRKPFVKKFGRTPYSAIGCRWAAKSPIAAVEELHSEGIQGGQFQLLTFAKPRDRLCTRSAFCTLSRKAAQEVAQSRYGFAPKLRLAPLSKWLLLNQSSIMSAIQVGGLYGRFSLRHF